MVCYKDRTFCKSDCINKKCPRLLTGSIIESAIKWWGSNEAPIALSDFSKTCPDYKPGNSGDW